MGGVITAGPLISAEALSNRTAKLPLVNISMPQNPIGTTTDEGIQSGLYYGYVGLVKEILLRLKKQMNDNNIKVIATGGLSNLIAKEIKEIDAIIPELTINGIKFIWEKEQ